VGILRANIGLTFTCAYRDAQGNIENGTNIVCSFTYKYIRLHSNAELVCNMDTEICFGVETLKSVAVWSQLMGVTDKTLKKL
jgi:hypothetical protein